MLSHWVSIEGTDGSGKTTVVQGLQGLCYRQAEIYLRDSDLQFRADISAEARSRLEVLREQVWDYNIDEPVWDYGNRYWLHALASWFWLYYEIVLHSAEAKFAITDGWALKHWARFRLHDDPSLRDDADRIFGALPWPRHMIILPPSGSVVPIAGTKQIKPSELGAFQEAGQSSFEQYQDRTWQQLVQIAAELNGHKTHVCVSPAADMSAVSTILGDIGIQ